MAGDANGASEMRMRERGWQLANESGRRVTHLRLADLSPAGLA